MKCITVQTRTPTEQKHFNNSYNSTQRGGTNRGILCSKVNHAVIWWKQADIVHSCAIKTNSCIYFKIPSKLHMIINDHTGTIWSLLNQSFILLFWKSFQSTKFILNPQKTFSSKCRMRFPSCMEFDILVILYNTLKILEDLR